MQNYIEDKHQSFGEYLSRAGTDLRILARSLPLSIVSQPAWLLVTEPIRQLDQHHTNPYKPFLATNTLISDIHSFYTYPHFQDQQRENVEWAHQMVHNRIADFGKRFRHRHDMVATMLATNVTPIFLLAADPVFGDERPTRQLIAQTALEYLRKESPGIKQLEGNLKIYETKPDGPIERFTQRFRALIDLEMVENPDNIGPIITALGDLLATSQDDPQWAEVRAQDKSQADRLLQHFRHLAVVLDSHDGNSDTARRIFRSTNASMEPWGMLRKQMLDGLQNEKLPKSNEYIRSLFYLAALQNPQAALVIAEIANDPGLNKAVLKGFNAADTDLPLMPDIDNRDTTMTATVRNGYPIQIDADTFSHVGNYIQEYLSLLAPSLIDATVEMGKYGPLTLDRLSEKTGVTLHLPKGMRPLLIEAKPFDGNIELRAEDMRIAPNILSTAASHAAYPVAEKTIQMVQRLFHKEKGWSPVKVFELLYVTSLVTAIQDKHFQLSPKVSEELVKRHIAPFVMQVLTDTLTEQGLPQYDHIARHTLAMVLPLWSENDKGELLTQVKNRILDLNFNLARYDGWRKLCYMLTPRASEYLRNRPDTIDPSYKESVRDISLEIIKGWDTVRGSHRRQRLLDIIANIQNPATVLDSVANPHLTLPDGTDDIVSQVRGLLGPFDEEDNQGLQKLITTIDEAAKKHFMYMMSIGVPADVSAYLQEAVRVAKEQANNVLNGENNDLERMLVHFRALAEGNETDETMKDMTTQIRERLNIVAQTFELTQRTEVSHAEVLEQVLGAFRTPKIEIQPEDGGEHITPIEAALAGMVQTSVGREAHTIADIIRAMKQAGTFDLSSHLNKLQINREVLTETIVSGLVKQIGDQFGKINEEILKQTVSKKLNHLITISKIEQAIYEQTNGAFEAYLSRMQTSEHQLMQNWEEIEIWLAKLAKGPILSLRQQCLQKLEAMEVRATLPLPTRQEVLEAYGLHNHANLSSGTLVEKK